MFAYELLWPIRFGVRSCSRMLSCTGHRLKLEGKVAVVTASTDGIGLAIAEALGRNGARVVVSSRKQENVSKAVERLKKDGIDVLGSVCHVGNAEHRTKLVNLAVEKFGGMDILVSNAGINPVATPILETTEDVWDKIFDINVKSAFLLAKESMPHLEKRKGSMVFVSSIAGYTPMPMLGAYSVSKTALIGLVKGLARECGARGVRVNGVAPGIIETRFSAAISGEPLRSQFTSNIPLGSPTPLANSTLEWGTRR